MNTSSWEPIFKNVENGFCIYQLKRDPPLAQAMYLGSKGLAQFGINLSKTDFEMVYAESLDKSKASEDILGHLFRRFNLDIPDDYRGHSLSVGDIIGLKTGGNVKFFMVESIGFAEYHF